MLRGYCLLGVGLREHQDHRCEEIEMKRYMIGAGKSLRSVLGWRNHRLILIARLPMAAETETGGGGGGGGDGGSEGGWGRRGFANSLAPSFEALHPSGHSKASVTKWFTGGGFLTGEMLLVPLLAAFFSSISGSLSSSLSSMSDGPPMTDPTASDLMAETCIACSCMSVENVLYVNCEKITVYRPTQLIPPASSLYHLNFQNNFLIVLYPNSFLNFTHAVSLQLGNNKLQNIEGGAFMGMSALKQLHLNNNELKVLRADTFQGIENLEYLQADYNLIKYIEKGAFNKLHKLKVLILNDNLIQALPENIFRFASLTHLDIRGNRIQNLPYLGVLEHIGRIVELQLDDNPWNCTCDLAPLKAWLENMPYNIFIGEAICETPSDLYGRLLKETNRQELCPMGTGTRLNLKNNHFMTLPVSGVLDNLRSLTQIDLEGNPWECSCDLVALKLWLQRLSDGVAAKEVKCASPVQFANIELRLIKNEILCPKLTTPPPISSSTPIVTSVSPAGVGKAPPGGPVPLSIMILSILVVLILTVFVAFCLLVFVLRRNKKPVGRQEGLGNQECGSLSLQLRRHGHKSGKKGSIPGDDLGGETFIPQTIEHIGKSHTCGIGRSSDMDAGFKFADSQRQKIILRNCPDKDKDLLSTLERNKRLSTIDELEEFLPNREPSLFIHNFLDSKRDFNSIGMGGYEIRYPEKTLDKKMKKSSLIGGNHSKIVVEQRKSEYYELKAKLQGTPDYLQVLEEQTALSKMQLPSSRHLSAGRLKIPFFSSSVVIQPFGLVKDPAAESMTHPTRQRIVLTFQHYTGTLSVGCMNRQFCDELPESDEIRRTGSDGLCFLFSCFQRTQELLV
ncbi:hypothetical protein CCH79_00017636 [Gambusia affinis]|uniref:LRRCT domain-containing protein n=1 Tax=Gambusia affinis TaxID=33528 RepID=A0A315W1H9_GAMAF|nr:hypothetical protein CCH79_00017636 [Gambusia affinis]